MLDEELLRLPRPLQEPVLLCLLEGQTRDEAARRLGVPLGTLKHRLERGRRRLRRALSRRGWDLSAALLGASLSLPGGGAFAFTPAHASSGASALAEAALRGTLLLKAKAALGLALLVGVAAGAAVLGPQASPAPAEEKAPAPAAAEVRRLDRFGDPLPVGAIARMGSIRWRHADDFLPHIDVAPSPTGQLVATASRGERGNGMVRVWDLSDGRQVSEFPREDTLSGGDLRFTPDGSRLMFLGDRGVVRFHDPRTGNVLAESKPLVEKDDVRIAFGTRRYSATSHVLTSDGGWVVTRDSGKLILAEITSDPVATPHRVELDTPPDFRLSDFACDGNTLTTYTHGKASGWKPLILCWDVRTGRLVRKTLIQTRSNGHVVASSRDGRRVVTWRYDVPPDDVVRVWDTETGAEVVGLEGAARRGYGYFRFSPDGNRLVTTVNRTETARTAIVWELDRGKVIARVDLPGWADQLFLSPEGKTLLAASFPGMMFGTWDLATGRRLSPVTGHESSVRHLAFTPDGTTLLTASTDPEERVTAWDAATGQKLRELAAPQGPSPFLSGRIVPFVRTPGGAVVTTGRGILVWTDGKTGRELRRVTPGPIATVMDPGDVFQTERVSLTLDPRSGRPAVLGLHSFGPSPVLLEPKYRYKEVVTLWDAEAGELLAHRAYSRDRYDHNQRIVSPDGRWLARTAHEPLQGRDGVRVWVEVNAALSGGGSFTLEHATDPGQPCLFTPDGQTLVTVATKRSPEKPDGDSPVTCVIRLWEMRTGGVRLEFPVPFEPSTFAISPDGRFLSGAGSDTRAISVWDLVTGSEVARRGGYRSSAQALAFRADGKVLASGHADGTALVWDLSGLPGVEAAAVDREAAWNNLASGDAGTAYRAILALAADPRGAAFLRDRVKPAVAAPADQVRRFIRDLDSPEFATRERAAAALEKLGDAADTQLRAALKGDLSSEQRRRIEGVLGEPRLTESDPGRLRALRCVEVLERSGSAEARTVLGGLAKGAPGARLTRESIAALRRLSQGPRKPG
ncbi:MAG TPA: sigma factor-like helix-turn-helix DNA-binding protein [Gemmataceae bacterium]